MYRSSFFAATLAVSAICLFAGAATADGLKGGKVFAENRKRIPVVQAAYVSSMGPDKQPVRWQAVDASPFRDAPSWQMAFDSMNTNPTTLLSFSNYYGANAGPQRLGNRQKNYMFANDMVLANNSARKTAKLIRVGVVWNPNGTDPRSGTADCMIRVYAANNFDTTAYGPAVSGQLTGVVGLFPGLGSDTPKYLEINMSSLGAGLHLPNGAGAIVVEFGTIGAGNTFVPLSGTFAAQPLLGNMCSPGEPQFPGTNPSGSTELEWDDDSDPGFPGSNKPDYIFEDFTNTEFSGFPFAELYGYDATADHLGILQGATALFVDVNALTISGKVSFQNLAVPAAAPQLAPFEIRSASDDTLIDSQTVALGSDGSYQLIDPRPTTGGDYRVYVKPTHWLRKGIAVNTTGLVSVTGKNFSVVNGDVDGDNAITVFDYNLLSAAFDSVAGDANWNPMADLDGDGSVTVFDYNILSANFDSFGD